MRVRVSERWVGENEVRRVKQGKVVSDRDGKSRKDSRKAVISYLSLNFPVCFQPGRQALLDFGAGACVLA